MRKLIFTLLAVISAINVCGQPVSEESAEATKGTVRVKIQTSLGDIVVRLYDATPIHRDNFVKLVKEGFYDGILFHRVIKDFMIQGGDPNSKGASADMPLGAGSTGYTLEAEIREGLHHKRGALAAARVGDAKNPERRSSGSQFYIVWGRTERGTPFLDGKYTVFGEVVEGLDVVEKIQNSPTAPGDRPIENIEMRMTLVD